jgi:hypothetical protein
MLAQAIVDEAEHANTLRDISAQFFCRFCTLVFNAKGQ